MEIKDWPGKGAGKTGSYFFGYNLLKDIGCYAENKETYKETVKGFNQLIKQILSLTVEGHIQLLYLNSSLIERRVVAFRFQSANAFDQWGEPLLDLGKEFSTGVWEPLRNDCQAKYWLSDVSNATLTVTFGRE